MARLNKVLKNVSLAAAFSLVVGPLSAAECLQGSAIYVDPESGLELSFSSSDENALSAHQFTIGHDASDDQLTGFVVIDGEPLRPVSYVLDNCPDGDITGEELQTCTVWSGVPYGKFSDDNIGLLPFPDEPAVEQILLPDFARIVIASSAWDKIKTINEPFEVFDFKECGAE